MRARAETRMLISLSLLSRRSNDKLKRTGEYAHDRYATVNNRQRVHIRADGELERTRAHPRLRATSGAQTVADDS